MTQSFLGSSLHYLAARVAARIGRHFYHAHLKPLGIRASEYWVLTLLDEKDGRAVGEIARQIFYEQPVATRLLERMARQRLITRRGTPTDKRITLAFITPRGKKLVAQLETLADQDERAGLPSFSAQEFEAMKKTLRKAIDDLSDREAAESISSPESPLEEAAA